MDHEYFWKNIQLEFGEIHVHLQNILRIQNLCNRSITRLTRDSIMIIEKNMRDMAGHLSVNWQQDTTGSSSVSSLEDIYGPRWKKKPEAFCFLEGEILCLLELADFLQKRGIESFLKYFKQSNSHSAPSRATAQQIQSLVLDETRSELYVANLISKIKGVYSALNTNDPELDRFMEKLDNIEVQWLPTLDNQLRATVVCPVCSSEGSDRRITLKVDAAGRWHIWSFTRHCDTFHYALPRSAKRKQYMEIGDMDDVMDDCVSNTTNHDMTVKIEDEVASNSALVYSSLT